MAKGITYSGTDSAGNVHTRYSAGHIKPIYTHAVVRFVTPDSVPNKHMVSYTAVKDRAVQERSREAGRSYKGKPCFAHVEVIELTATEGR